MKARVVRLYPLYLVSLTVAFVYLEHFRHKGVVPLSAFHMLLILICAMFFCPIAGGGTLRSWLKL